MARWMPKNDLKLKLNAISKELGIDISPNAAFLDPELVLIKRLMELVQEGLLTLTPGMEIKVQVLGDATTVWRSMGVNGTTVVMKAPYNDKNVNGDKDEGDGVNCVQNQRASGFYLGDDTLAELREHARDLPDQLAEIAEQGITVNGVPVRIRLFLGGDTKFLNSMCGLPNNSATFSCPFCICHKDLLHLSLAELIKIKQDYDNRLPLLKRHHLAARRKIKKKKKPRLHTLAPATMTTSSCWHISRPPKTVQATSVGRPSVQTRRSPRERQPMIGIANSTSPRSPDLGCSRSRLPGRTSSSTYFTVSSGLFLPFMKTESELCMQ